MKVRASVKKRSPECKIVRVKRDIVRYKQKNPRILNKDRIIMARIAG
jgi:ribosomal protein L36